MKCRIYTDIHLVPAGVNPVIMLFPFFGAPQVSADDPDFGRFDDYINAGNDLFELSSREECDVFVLPFDYSFDKRFESVIREFIKEAKSFEKKVLLFYNADDDTSIELENVIVFRTSFYLSKKRTYEYAFPGWSVDFLKAYSQGTLPETKHTDKPSVSYCGYVDYVDESWKIWLNNLFGRKKSKPWERLRGRAVRNVLQSSKVKAQFLIRDGFWASGVADKKAARQEYAENMMSADYAICCRGGGNFSYRLYEVMSLGKIPVFINTDCVLPWMDEISWREIMVWVELDELDSLDQKVWHFHHLHQDRLGQIQQNIRNTYESHLSPVGFFSKLALFLKG